ncbi:MAG: acyl-phosphate glycerol 3-phosphate acyltransferase [Verrucomicrobia bacterium]|nr:MAG: acyl-phosphate glycerol 3-phosphate acyltransferase [Verrucomicrobiota bacterium]
MSYLYLAFAVSAGYLIGSLPFGYWVARAHGVDIMKVGSGNPGATNVKRAVGGAAGNVVFLLDFLKGVVAVSWVWLLPANEVDPVHLSLLGLVGAILGHSFSIFLGFKGGKGVATTMGGMVTLMPISALIGIGVWLILFFPTRYVSLASIGMAVALPISRLILDGPDLLLGFATLVAVFIVVRHRSNIRRLMEGRENRFERRQKRTKSP